MRTAAVADSGEFVGPGPGPGTGSPERRLHSSRVGRHSDARVDEKYARDRPPSQERVQHIIEVR